MKLKQLYGAKPEDDLWTFKVTNEIRDNVRDQTNRGTYHLPELNMTLLQLLWVVFECDQQPYFHRVFQKPDLMKERPGDEREVQRIIHPTHDSVIKLQKAHIPLIVNLLTQPRNPFGPEHPRWRAIFSENPEDASMSSPNFQKHLDDMKVFVTSMTEYWMKKQEVWGYIDRNDCNRLVAVCFLEPSENHEASLRWLLLKERAKAFFKRSSLPYNHLVDMFNQSKAIRKENSEPTSNCIHQFAVNLSMPEDETFSCGQELLQSCCDYSWEHTFAFLYDSNPARPCFEKFGFTVIQSKDSLLVLKKAGPGRFAQSPWKKTD